MQTGTTPLDPSVKQKFLVTIKDPDHKVKEGDAQRTIEQFTPTGLETAVEYYNQKYPERGSIHSAIMEIDQKTLTDFNNTLKGSAKDENNMVDNPVIKNTMAELSDQLSGAVSQNLLSLKDKIKTKGPQKILLTLAGNKDGVVTIHHSIPFILTNDKLILLRNEDDEFGQNVYGTLAEKLGTKLVQNGLQPEYNLERKKERGVMQADHTSCHFLALGILKDLTKEDLKQVSAFEKNFDPLPKSLKYSQSLKYIGTSLSEEGQKQKVKNVGTLAAQTALQYVEKNKTQEGDQITTRITTKFNKFKLQLDQAIGEVGEDSSPKDIAAKILKNKQNAKAGCFSCIRSASSLFSSNSPSSSSRATKKARVVSDAPGSPRATTTSAPFLPPSSPEIGRS